MSRLLAGRGSRASSQASIPMLGDEEPVYEAPPSSASGSYSSKSGFILTTIILAEVPMSTFIISRIIRLQLSQSHSECRFTRNDQQRYLSG